MGITFDDGELEGSSYLGEGEHSVRVSAIKPMQSKDKGTPMIEVEFTAMSGKKTRDWFVTTGNKFKLAALAMAAGYSKEQLKAGAFETPNLAGKSLKLVREAKGQNAEGKKQYENTYLPGASGSGGAVAPTDDIPF